MPADFLDVIDIVMYIFSGWYYLFSPSFRAQTHKRWRTEGAISIFLDLLFGVFGVGLSLLLVWFVISGLRS